MTRKMIVNAVDPEEVRIAILSDGRLEDFDIETRGSEKNKGNIYKARVVDVEPSLNAAFVDYGAEKQGFLTAGDVDPRLLGKAKGNRAGINELVTPGQEIIVQIAKDEVGSKGAVLSTYLSLAGRYLVLTPDSRQHGVSRKIDDDDTRQAMRAAVNSLDVPEHMGIILRTAGRDRTRIEMARDLKVLLQLWQSINDEADGAKAPSLLFKEQDVVIRALRDYFTADVDEVVLDNDEAFDRAAEYMHMVMPRYKSVLSRYVERRPIFHHYKIETQLDALFSPRVELKTGASIVIEPTEALVSIDVNSGKQKTGDHEETALQTNMEAAIEVARQLRLRDLGGIVVIDFIDMNIRKNQARVERAVKVVCRKDKARIKIGRISRNGTLELTRQRIRTSIGASVFHRCPVCKGTGRILNPASHAAAVFRRLVDRASRGDLLSATVKLESEAANILRTERWESIQELEGLYNIRIDINPVSNMAPGTDDFSFESNPDAKAISLPTPNFGPAPIPEDLRAEIEAAEAELRKQEDEEFSDLADVDDEDSDTREQDADETRSRGRNRNRQDRPRTKDPLDMPSFEMIDPKSLGLRKKKPRKSRPDSRRKDGVIAETYAEGSKKRRRRSRGGRGRDKSDQVRQPGRRGASAGKQAPEQAPQKQGFFSWLFGKK